MRPCQWPPRAGGVRRVWLGGDLGAFRRRARVDDHAIARRQAAEHEDARSERRSGLHRLDMHHFVRADDAELRAALEIGDRTLRHEQRALDRLGVRRDAAVLAGPQQLLRIGKDRADAHRARGRIDLPIGGEKLAGSGVDGTVREGELQPAAGLPEILRAARRVDLLGDAQVLLLAEGKIGADRIDLRNSREQGRRPDQIADLRRGDAGDAVEERADLGEIEVESRRVDRGLRGLDGCLAASCTWISLSNWLCAIARSLASGVSRSTSFSARPSCACASASCASACASATRKVRSSTSNSTSPLRTSAALAVVAFDEIARDLRPDLPVGVAVERRDPFAGNLDGLRGDLQHGHGRWRGGGRRRRRRFVPATGGGDDEDRRQDHRERLDRPSMKAWLEQVETPEGRCSLTVYK